MTLLFKSLQKENPWEGAGKWPVGSNQELRRGTLWRPVRTGHECSSYAYLCDVKFVASGLLSVAGWACTRVERRHGHMEMLGVRIGYFPTL